MLIIFIAKSSSGDYFFIYHLKLNKMPILGINTWNNTHTILATLIGRKIVDINYDGTYSAPITLILDNGKKVCIDADGDDMAHTVIEEEE